MEGGAELHCFALGSHGFTDTFGVFSVRPNENPRCLQRKRIREIREIRVSPKKNIQEIAWRFRKKVVYLQPKRYKIIGDRNYD